MSWKLNKYLWPQLYTTPDVVVRPALICFIIFSIYRSTKKKLRGRGVQSEPHKQVQRETLEQSSFTAVSLNWEASSTALPPGFIPLHWWWWYWWWWWWWTCIFLSLWLSSLLLSVPETFRWLYGLIPICTLDHTYMLGHLACTFTGLV